jgi:hypothetical protein
MKGLEVGTTKRKEDSPSKSTQCTINYVYGNSQPCTADVVGTNSATRKKKLEKVGWPHQAGRPLAATGSGGGRGKKNRQPPTTACGLTAATGYY